MEQLSKESIEYRSNGHYVIEGESHFSIWAYKNRMGIKTNNNSENGHDSANLFSRGVRAFHSKPDFGNFDDVLLFSLTDLDKFYNS